MMDFELKLEKPLLKTAWVEGLVMGISYFFGKTGGKAIWTSFEGGSSHADGSRRPLPYDTLFCDKADQRSVIHFHRHYCGHSAGFWICQGQGHRLLSPGLGHWGGRDSIHRGAGCWRVLWHCERNQFVEAIRQLREAVSVMCGVVWTYLWSVNTKCVNNPETCWLLGGRGSIDDWCAAVHVIWRVFRVSRLLLVVFLLTSPQACHSLHSMLSDTSC